MQLGLITDSVGSLPLEKALDFAAELNLDTVEIATGNWSEAPHANLADLVSSGTARKQLSEAVASRGLTLSALNANGNQLHPVSGLKHDQVVRDTITVAGELGVPTVVLTSGLPAARGDRTPNWITTSWPPETLQVLDYQWNEVAIPYWEDLGRYAKARGVRLAVEMIGSQLVFNVATMLRLREAVDSEVVGCNLDPSHLMWMGADISDVIHALGSSIFHVHAKDAVINRKVSGVNGVLDTLPPSDAKNRAWNYVTLGLGHPGGAGFWADFVYQLRSVGYDGPLNIEHEDILVSSREGVTRSVNTLSELILRDTPDWTPARI
ncbi:sugar phosphate isomerase/epimerase [Arthrobacter sp. SLBN-112]|uniref:sugar phosphate isomerase/epimerase family protein n=1 Tax=Arthrobacter sp. SLBN-112 TaxID=2768452 RepID=UPI0027AFDDA8|nr:sugar phosphate isomerase/epimerase [Arthrobacter sp. SLBN-112]MDQ0799030.1 sugar phosphate isomerase/epimerase [Arthrobacter sp. SLBN-112]